MRVLHLTPEIAPWSKSGGLGDATAALAKSVAALGHEVRVITPLHGSIANASAFTTHRTGLNVGIFPAEVINVRRTQGQGFEVLFLEHPELYGSTAIYAGESWKKATLLSRAALDLCLADHWIPDVIHCHDWTVGLVPVLLNTILRDTALGSTATVLTLHNLQHQGLFGTEVLKQLGLPEWLMSADNLECLGGVNMLKGGLYHATRLTTVSPTYAREITEPAQGFGLDPVIRHRLADLEGILNGVDTDDWNPARDTLIPARYDARNLAGKAVCKSQLQIELGLDPDPGVPLIGIISRLWEQKGLDLALDPLRLRLRDGTIQLAVLGSGDPDLEARLLALAQAFPQRAHVRIGYDNRLAHRIEAGSDFFLMPSRFEPCGLNQLYSMAYGTLPIVRRTGGLADTVQGWAPGVTEATGIVFEHADSAAIGWALDQALSLRHHHSEAFAAMRILAMQRSFPWSVAAVKYVACYEEAVRQRRSAFSVPPTAEPSSPPSRPKKVTPKTRKA